MGIRFFCPNGHKLNVKEFQAGQKGICPTCGAKMQVPTESTRPSSREERAMLQGGACNNAASTIPVESEAPAATPTATAAVAQPNATPPASNVVWYVRPSSGGQYGPANNAVIQSWIADGRVAPDALVWREGWRDWQQAGNVFPQLSRGVSIPGLEDVFAEPTVNLHQQNRLLKRPPPSRRTQALVFGVLVLSVVILTILSIVFLLRQ